MAEGATEQPKGEAQPKPTDPGWSDYVMAQFAEKELSKDGHPRINGLRRVATLLVGEIVRSVSSVVTPPTPQNQGTAVVEFEVVLRTREGVDRTFRDVADVWAGNCEPEFARFASAMAATRAEGRALRKALLLDKAAAEELTTAPVMVMGEGGAEPLITDVQKSAIDRLCQRNDINVLKFFASSTSFAFTSIDRVTRNRAQAAIQKLNEYQNDQGGIPPEIKGYDPAWRQVKQAKV
jgi:hypothetical protein